MRLPFSEDQFFAVFRAYNQAVWPAQILLVALGLISIILLLKHRHAALICVILSFFWAWMAIFYHLVFFARINPVAKYFSVLFLIQSGLLLWHGVIKRTITFNRTGKRYNFLGSILVAYSLILYPGLNMWFGHHYPNTPTFGVPCPTTIFTLGMLLFADDPFPRHIFFVPLVWSVIGTSAANLLHVPADYGLAVAGIFALEKLFQRRKNRVSLKV